jgi:excisionase family DNA binding protein
MSATKNTAATPPIGYGPYLSAEGVATALGVSRRTIHRLVDAGELSALRVGRQRRIPQSELDAFVERHTEAPERGSP